MSKNININSYLDYIKKNNININEDSYNVFKQQQDPFFDSSNPQASNNFINQISQNNINLLKKINKNDSSIINKIKELQNKYIKQKENEIQKQDVIKVVDKNTKTSSNTNIPLTFDKNTKTSSNTNIPLTFNKNDKYSGRFRISSEFGSRILKGKQENHGGLDVATPLNTEIKAFTDGKITNVSNSPRGGNIVEFTASNGEIFKFMHLSKTPMSIGQKINKGDVIAITGNTGRSTGPHVHIEYQNNGQKQRIPDTYLNLMFK